VVTNVLYRIAQNYFELDSKIPHQCCLAHRVQEWDLITTCSQYVEADNDFHQCHLVDDARTDPISTKCKKDLTHLQMI